MLMMILFSVLWLGTAAPQQPPSSLSPAHLYQTNQAEGIAVSLLLKRDDRVVETSPQSIFRSGDRIKVSLTTNFDGFVYVLTVNPAGELTLLFPSSDVGTFNAVRRGVTYQIPSKLDGWFKFQGQKGQERLFVTMSPEPVPEIEQEFKSAGIVRTAQDVLPSGTGAATAPATPKDPSRPAPRVEPKTRGA